MDFASGHHRFPGCDDDLLVQRSCSFETSSYLELAENTTVQQLKDHSKLVNRIDTPRKLTWKILIYNRKYIFKRIIFHCHVSLPEGIPKIAMFERRYCTFSRSSFSLPSQYGDQFRRVLHFAPMNPYTYVHSLY